MSPLPPRRPAIGATQRSVPTFSRRQVLTGMAGVVLLAACGDDDTASEGVSAGDDAGYAMLQYFAPAGALAADQPVRIPFGLGTAAGQFRAEVPDTLEVALLDPDGNEIDRQALPSLGDGLPRRYYAYETTLPEGIYTLAADIDGADVELPVQIHSADTVLLVQPGDPMRPVETPTTDDALGVDPICTRTPPCEFHQQTLTAALDTGNPVVFMISTPTFCQTAVCGPVLDIMIGLSADYPDVEFVHAEVFENPGDGVTADTSVTDAVRTYGMEFEPSVIVAGADGTVVQRLDFIFAEEELRDALDQVTA